MAACFLGMITIASSPMLASGLEFGWQKSTGVGIGICVVLGVLSILSWAAMAVKLSLLRKSRLANAEFLTIFRTAPHPLALFQTGERFDFAPFYHIYYSAARELAFHMLGVDQPDRTFATRLQGAGRIAPSQMEAVRLAMERASTEAALRFEQRLGLATIALSVAPFVGLLGTVWGVMDSFAALAVMQQGTAAIQVMAPGVCAALLTTVVGLLVVIPSILGYNLIVNKIRTMIARLDNFVSELNSIFDRHYVDHHVQGAELPSLGSMGSPNVVSFSAGARTMPSPTAQAANH